MGDSFDKWDIRMLRLAREVSKWSKDPSTKIGVVIADRSGRLESGGLFSPNPAAARIVSTGYNGFPYGIADDDRLLDRDEKYELVVHAEVNAILAAGDRARGADLYMYGYESAPCRNCLKHVIAAGIRRVVSAGIPTPARWKSNLERAEETMVEAHIKLVKVDTAFLEGV